MSSPAPPKDQFTVGWICALPIEYTAARAFLDEKFESDHNDLGDDNDYTLGRIRKHHVVVTVCPDGEYGTTSAANAARDLARSFPNVRFGLMVGIGGGIPSDAHDIRLGDVVVSSKVGKHSAVLQYDLGKQLADGTFEIISHLDNPPTCLRNVVSALRAIHDEQGNDLQARVDEAVKSIKKRSKFSRPNEETDVLYSSDASSSEEVTEEGVNVPERSDAIIRRPPRNEEDDIPAIHYGPIGSGNTLMRDAKMRDLFRQGHGLLCFEMEAAGLMNRWPCLVIRGICDYADSHKNKLWQGYAAMTAAAYAKTLLERLQPQQVEAAQSMSELIGVQRNIEKHTDSTARSAAATAQHTAELITGQKSSAEQFERLHKETSDRKLSARQMECIRMFNKVEYNTFKSNVQGKRVENTCLWVLEHDLFKEWLIGSGGKILWISADPGCGKSVLAKSLVEDDITEMRDGPVQICHFFFKDNAQQNQLSLALCAILHQLFDYQPHLTHHALEYRDKHGEQMTGSPEILWEILSKCGADMSAHPFVCVFDALDECRNQDQLRLINFLTDFHRNVGRQSNSRSKFLVTSRPYRDIEEAFTKAIKHLPEIHLAGEREDEQINREIDLVIRARVDRLASDHSLRSETTTLLQEKLLGMQNRTYLWLTLVLADVEHELRDCMYPTLDFSTISAGLDENYQKILDRAPTRDHGTLQNILRIIVGARRPLSVQEMDLSLRLAALPRNSTSVWNDFDVEKTSNRIRHLCGLFIFIKDSTVHLLHQTAKEFLIRTGPDSMMISRWTFDITEAEALMALVCIRYVMVIEEQEKINDIDEYSDTDSMFDYAEKRWPEHYRKAGNVVGVTTAEILSQLYDIDSMYTKKWFHVHLWSLDRDTDRSIDNMQAINSASLTGLDNIVEALSMEESVSLESRDSNDATPLMRAAEEGHISTARLLLLLGADVNAQGDEYGTALHAAALRGHGRVVEMLLTEGANVNAQGGRYGNALQAAARAGNPDIARMLIDNGADVNLQGGYCGTALHAATYYRETEIIKLLIESGADVNIKAGDDGTALHAAAFKGETEIVKLLIETGADVNIEGGMYGTAIRAAVSQGHEDVCRIFLDSGVNIDTLFVNDFHDAIAMGHEEVVKMLLQRGLDVNARSGKYCNCLYAATWGLQESVASLLVDTGADITVRLSMPAREQLESRRFYGGMTLLHLAAEKGYSTIIRCCIVAKVDINAQDRFHRTPLHYAALEGHCDVVMLLVEAGAQLDLLDVDGRAAIDSARVGSRYEALMAPYDGIIDYLSRASEAQKDEALREEEGDP